LPVKQHVIPRFADGATYPAGQLRGTGANSVLVATAETQNLLAATRSTVITEGYDQLLSEWQVGSIPLDPPAPAYSPAVLQPQLVNCTVAGYSTTGYATTDYVNDVPATVAANVPDLYDGYRGFANGGIVDNVCFFYVPGTALDIARAGSDRYGQMLPHDRLKWVISRVSVRRVFRGIDNEAVDSYMRDIEVEGFRDWGVRLFSSVQFQNIHTYGGGRSDEDDGSGGAGLWLTGEQNLGSAVYVEHSPIGLRIHQAGKKNSINQITSHHCPVNNIRIDGGANCISQIDLRSSPGNILITGGQNCVSDGSIVLQDGGTGIKIETDGRFHMIGGIAMTGYQENPDPTPDDPKADNAVGFDADVELNDCKIQLVITHCAKGIDLDDAGVGRVGSRNIIIVNTDTVDTPYELPSNVTQTVNTNDTNQIYINGVRYYKQP
jgi:hypothetical protein